MTSLSLYANAFLLILCLVLGAISYNRIGRVAELNSELQSTYTKLKDLQVSKDTVVASNDITDTVSTDKEEKIVALEKDKQSLVDKINSTPKSNPCSSVNSVVGTSNEINIDSRLPDAVIRVLNDSDNH